MAFRCLLVSLVASLGFDLPSGQDVTSWTLSGRNWVSARAVDLSALEVEASGWLGLNDPTMKRMAELAPASVETATVAETPSSVADLVFESVSDGMAQVFAADLVATMAAAAPAAPADAVIADTLKPDEPVAGPELDSLALAFPAPFADSTAEEGEAREEATTLPSSQLSAAVRLTREAVLAWATLAHSVGAEVVQTH